MSAAKEFQQDDFQYFCETIERIAGIHMKPAKFQLVRTRLNSRLAQHGLNTYSEYRELLQSLPDTDPEWEQFINLLTTNKTDFFREPKHFEFLVQKILPAWLKTGDKTFKVWSAAASTGEEPYTLAMVLESHLPKDRDYKILATDVDTDVIKASQNAVYPLAKKHEIPTEFHNTSIDLGHSECRNFFRIKRHLKDKVVCKRHNLVDNSSPGHDVFDLVLCRNVLIYFDKDTIEFVARKLYQTTKPGGHFFIGHSESLQGIKHDWQSFGPSVFKKK